MPHRAPLTQAQLEMISAETTRASEKALKKYVRAASIAFFGLIAAIILVFNQYKEARHAVVRSGTVVSVASCNRDYDTINTLRGVLEAFKASNMSLFKAGELSQTAYATSAEFTEKQLARLDLPDCRTAEDLLTDNPNEIPSVSPPLFPGPKDGG